MTAKYRLPIVTLLLVSAILVGAVLLVIDPQLIHKDGFYASHPTLSGVVVGPFLHVNLIHLLGNLIFLAAVGGSLELATGSLRFVIVYGLSALAGEGVHWIAFRNDASAPALVGASAAIAGCASYYAIRYYNLKIPVAPKISLSILNVVGIWAVLQILGAFVHLGDSHTPISYWSHVGGLAMGAILCPTFRAPDLGQDKLDEAVLDEARKQGPQVMLAAAKLMLKSKPNDRTALHQMAEAASLTGATDDEASALLKLIELESLQDSVTSLQRLHRLNRLGQIGASKRLEMGKQLRATEPELADQLLESLGSVKQGPLQPEALFEMANCYYKTNPDKAQQAMAILHRDCQDHPLHTQARARGWIS